MIEAKTIAAEDVSNVALLFVAEMNKYHNGNVLISNWNGHSKDKNQPKLVELDAKNQVVWTLAPNDEIKNISAVYSFRKKK